MSLVTQIEKLGRWYIIAAWLGIALLAVMEIVNTAIDHRIYAVLGRFWLNGESNIPTWFSSMLYAALAGVLLLLHCSDQKLRTTGGRLRFGWLALAAVALYLSVDETAMLHEEISRVIGTHYFHEPADGPHPSYWINLYLPGATLLFVYCWRFFRKIGLERHLVKWCLAAGAFLVLAQLAERVDLLGVKHSPFCVIFEECAEMAAPLCVFTGFFGYWRSQVANQPDQPTK